MLTTSFEKLKEADACKDRYRHLAEALGGITAYGDTTPITIEQIIEHNGLNDALWAFIAVNETDEAKGIAIELVCACAEQCLDVFEKEYPEDKRPRQAIEAARKFQAGEISEDELNDAAMEADAAAMAANKDNKSWAAWAVARSAAWVAMAVARSAAWVARSSWVAMVVATEAAEAAAAAAEKDRQKNKLLELLHKKSLHDENHISGSSGCLAKGKNYKVH